MSARDPADALLRWLIGKSALSAFGWFWIFLLGSFLGFWALVFAILSRQGIAAMMALAVMIAGGAWSWRTVKWWW